ncbi:glycosyltransferase N-terminal domain-containing protein [Psychrobacter sp. KH172YL61]|uniref:glycosyltransferase N-terminal domain-containing protein n=1 Tax=Psychrobacter sp. KH172YL61 TaxID=2517899 RepID=UPI0022B7AB13|nr:glycosyltransferase N-terminal domain-containing protein [Psychrobacter sp. KH172YL61]
MGETNTVAPLLDALLASGYQIWLTNTTQTGFARGASRFADAIAQNRMSHSYVPVDTP